MHICFDSDLPEEGLARLAQALEGLWEGDDLSAELLLVSEEEIRELNARERGVDSVTDVLSFPSMDGIKGQAILAEEHGEELDEDGNVFLGSIVICEKRAREQAQEYGHSFERELWYLAVHGILHCLGYDHMTEEEKREMREKEESVMQKLDLRRDS
ncbi:MAG TPA: rRNA maturation RNase YbeY [Firmicutes bacterium]|nr:rRNA maturation RNase YbeY [Bacillota bacterium]